MLLNVSIFGFILAGIILIFSSYQKSMNAFLAAYLLFANLHSLAYYTIFENENAELAAFFAVHFTPFYFLTLPFLHLYIISHRKEFKFRARYFLFLIPFFVALTNISPFFLIPFSEKIVLAKAFLNDAEVLNRVPFLFSTYYQQSLVRPLFNLVFILFTIITYYRERQTLEFQKAKFNEQNFVLFVLIISCSLNGLSFIFLLNKLLIASIGVNFFQTVSYNAVNTLFSYLSAGQNLLLLFFPQIMFREQIISEKIPVKNRENESQDDSIIPYERLLEIDQIIKQYITNHPYLIKGFTVTKITLDTGIPAHQISLYYKDFLNTNFNDWKNKLRIEYAVAEIKSGNWSNYTVEKITNKSGFSSRSNFNKAFIACMNQTPSEYLKELNA
jgi:AraC-like DNA-binding protein